MMTRCGGKTTVTRELIERLFRVGPVVLRWKPPPVPLSGPIGKTGRCAAAVGVCQTLRELRRHRYSAHLGALGGGSFKVLGSHPDREGVIVKSQITWINGPAPIRVDGQLNPTNNGYKVTDLIVSGLCMASAQRSDLASVIRRNSGQVQTLLAA
jgi:hypothetical protein